MFTFHTFWDFLASPPSLMWTTCLPFPSINILRSGLKLSIWSAITSIHCSVSLSATVTCKNQIMLFENWSRLQYLHASVKKANKKTIMSVCKEVQPCNAALVCIKQGHITIQNKYWFCNRCLLMGYYEHQVFLGVIQVLKMLSFHENTSLLIQKDISRSFLHFTRQERFLFCSRCVFDYCAHLAVISVIRILMQCRKKSNKEKWGRQFCYSNGGLSWLR